MSFPDYSDAVDIAQLEQFGVVGLSGQRVQWGTFTLMVAQTDTAQAVTFAPAFSGASRVLCSVMPLGLAGSLADVRWGNSAGATDGIGTPTGFVFQARRTTGSTSTIRVNWIAIGPA